MVYQQESLKVLRFLCCVIAGKTYCVKMSLVRGVRDINDISINQESSQSEVWLSKGDICCPVISLDSNLNQCINRSRESKKIVIFSVPSGFFGISVDSIGNIFEVISDCIFLIPSIVGGSSLHYFDEIAVYKNQYILSLSPLSIYQKFISKKVTMSPTGVTNRLNYPESNLYIPDNMRKKIIIFTTTLEQSLLYGLSITQIPQILQLSSILPIPGSEVYINGVIEWRGIILPVLDLAFCIEKKKSDIKSDGRILVVRLTSLPLHIGIIIQSQIVIQSFPIERDLGKQDSLLKIESIHHQFKLKNKTLVIPNIDEMIIHNEKVSP